MEDLLKDMSECHPGYGDHSQLKDDVTGMPHDPAAHFDETDFEASQRPVLETSRQVSNPASEVILAPCN